MSLLGSSCPEKELCHQMALTDKMNINYLYYFSTSLYTNVMNRYIRYVKLICTEFTVYRFCLRSHLNFIETLFSKLHVSYTVT